MNKGFTLIELIGVIIILGLLLTIAYTNINKSLETSKTTINDAQKSSIESSAQNWFFDNKSHLKNTFNTDNEVSCSVSLNTLNDEGYIEKPDNISNCNCVEITKKEAKEKYTYKCSNNCIESCVMEE